MIECKSYKCSICGKLYETDRQVIFCESDCKKKSIDSQIAHDEIMNKIQHRKNEAFKIVKEVPAIKLLVSNGFIKDARILCIEYAKFLWDCGTSSGWEKLYNDMIDYAQRLID